MAGFDGFRVDTVKHCELGFWQDWCPRIHGFAAANGKPDFFMFGESFDASDAKCGSYAGARGGGGRVAHVVFSHAASTPRVGSYR